MDSLFLPATVGRLFPYTPFTQTAPSPAEIPEVVGASPGIAVLPAPQASQKDGYLFKYIKGFELLS